ncbi:MAG: hypothetical protein HQL51_02435 [Magnetococcales bacterium]|nr:hypothetical protein [Magnetococcales bacterium]
MIKGLLLGIVAIGAGISIYQADTAIGYRPGGGLMDEVPGWKETMKALRQLDKTLAHEMLGPQTIKAMSATAPAKPKVQPSAHAAKPMTPVKAAAPAAATPAAPAAPAVIKAAAPAEPMEKQPAYLAGRQTCIDNPASCGIQIPAAAKPVDQNEAYQAGMRACAADPKACGIQMPAPAPAAATTPAAASAPAAGDQAVLSWNQGTLIIPSLQAPERDSWGRPTGKNGSFKATLAYNPAMGGTWRIVTLEPTAAH